MANQIVSQKDKGQVQVSLPESKRVGRRIVTRLVGVTYGLRQESISKVRMHDDIWLVREPQNRVDKNAILVTRSCGEELGYVNRHIAARIARYLDAYQFPLEGRVGLLVGGGRDGFALGLVIEFSIPTALTIMRKFKQRQFQDWEDW